MPDQPLTCEQARRLMNNAEAAAEVALHMATCDQCLDELLHQVGEPATSAEIPKDFARRTAARARLREGGREHSASLWAAAAACLLCPVLAGWLVMSGALANLLGRIPPGLPSPALLAVFAAVEVTIIFAGLWRLSRV